MGSENESFNSDPKSKIMCVKTIHGGRIANGREGESRGKCLLLQFTWNG